MRIRSLFLGIFIAFILALVGLAFVYSAIRSGRNNPQPQKPEEVHITFIEGWTNKDIANYLEKQKLIDSKTFLASAKTFNLSSFPELSFKPKSADLEGFIFPDTYFVAKNASSEAILQKALSNFVSKWKKATEFSKISSDKFVSSAYPEKPLSPYEILILASIIEKETGRNVSALSGDQLKALEEERKTVAGIFYNRLIIGQALQSDATVNYVTGKDDPSISEADTKINSPYNTYKYTGLPPGPICNPSLMSIEAALNPIKTEYMYFLHRQSDGQVFYAKTLEEHNANKAKYLK